MLDFKNDLLTKQLTKLHEEALKPMSIIEIKEKFNLSFPFKVKRVKYTKINKFSSRISFDGVTSITEIKINPDSGTPISNNVEPYNPQLDKGYPFSGFWKQSAEVQDYILYEEN